MGKFLKFFVRLVKISAIMVVALFVVFAFLVRQYEEETIRACNESGISPEVCRYAKQYANYLSPHAQIE